MDNLARNLHDFSFAPGRAMVRAETNGLFALEHAGGTVLAKRAAGCLLKPEQGDLVLWWSDGRDAAYVLTVLERLPDLPALLSVEGDLALNSEKGSVSINGAGRVELISGREVRLAGPTLGMDSLEMEVSTQKLALWARMVETRAGVVKLIAKSLDSVIDRVQQKLKDCIRRVEGTDITKAGQICQEAEQLYSLDCGYGAINADKDVKIDAEHIHLG